MSDAPPLDTSRPSRLRLTGFLLSVVGALLIGVGAAGTWMTVGIRAVANNLDTTIPGTDLPDGTTALVCAVVVLIATLGTRLVRSPRAATALAVVALVGGFIALAVGGAFLMTGQDRSAVLDALAIPESQWEQLGAFREMGAGPLLVVIGGALAFAGGVLSVAWAMRGRENPGPADESSEA